MKTKIEIHELHVNKGSVCERILRSLPNWFGIEAAIVRYVKDVENMTTFAARVGDEIVGFVSIHPHNDWTSEIHVMGVLESFHSCGIGTRLLATAEDWVRGKKFEFLTVKTVSASSKDPYYAKTREFYLSKGFRPLEEFKTLWDAHNPCLFMAKRLEVSTQCLLVNQGTVQHDV